MSRHRTHPLVIAATMLLAAMLTIMPLPDTLALWRPYWMAMVVIYWCIESPEQVGLGAAFAAGVLLDLLTGTMFGQHPLSLVIIAYIIGRFRLRIRFFPLWQQALVVLAVLINDRLIYLWVLALSGQGLPDWQVLLPPVSAMLLWPWLFLLLDASRRRARTR